MARMCPPGGALPGLLLNIYSRWCVGLICGCSACHPSGVLQAGVMDWMLKDKKKDGSTRKGSGR